MASISVIQPEESTTSDVIQPEEPTTSNVIQPTTSDDYFDIMLVGKTGLGKTTTADKLLAANPTGKVYPSKPSMDNTDEDADDVADKGLAVHYDDMSMWNVSEKHRKEMTKRLKKLIQHRTMKDPHKEINKMREKSEPSQSCELISNDTSKVRVLDLPGFFGSDFETSNADPVRRADENNLQIMRNVLRIKAAHNFKFNRIIYFLPEKGPLNRHSQILQIELATMERYFGQSIFESMVVVATFPTDVYRFIPEGTTDIFTQSNLETTQDHLKAAMSAVFKDMENIPDLPIVFLSYTDTCNNILDLVQKAEVVQPAAELSFNSSVCARCAVIIKDIKGISPDKDMLSCVTVSRNEETPYSESTCHPMFQPKHTTLKRIAGGILHLITFYKFPEKWPGFLSSEEICIACGEDPGTRGCKRVKAKYFYQLKCQMCLSCTECKICRSTKCRGNRWNDCDNCEVCERCQTCIPCRDYIEVDHSNEIERYVINIGER